MKANELRKISNNQTEKRLKDVDQVIKYLKRYARLGFQNASPNIKESCEQKIASQLRRRGYRVFVTYEAAGPWMAVEW